MGLMASRHLASVPAPLQTHPAARPPPNRNLRPGGSALPAPCPPLRGISCRFRRMSCARAVRFVWPAVYEACERNLGRASGLRAREHFLLATMIESRCQLYTQIGLTSIEPNLAPGTRAAIP